MGHWTWLLAMAVTTIVCMGCCFCAEEHIVGDYIWSIPPSNDFFSNWSSQRSFLIGDTLVFRFETGLHTVIQVSRREYDGCKAENPFKTFLAGPVVVSLDQEGVFYFICSLGNYCLLGQKLSVAVHHPPSPGKTVTTHLPST